MSHRDRIPFPNSIPTCLQSLSKYPSSPWYSLKLQTCTTFLSALRTLPHKRFTNTSIILIILVIPFIYDDLKYLDVINLGRDQAINLGVDYDKLVRKLFVTVSIFISISTALVGPITFLGLLVVNLSRQMIAIYKHKYLITMSVLLSVFVLVTGQLIAERIFDFSTPVSVIINLIGGIYFMYLLLKESRI